MYKQTDRQKQIDKTRQSDRQIERMAKIISWDIHFMCDLQKQQIEIKEWL